MRKKTESRWGIKFNKMSYINNEGAFQKGGNFVKSSLKPLNLYILPQDLHVKTLQKFKFLSICAVY